MNSSPNGAPPVKRAKVRGEFLRARGSGQWCAPLPALLRSDTASPHNADDAAPGWEERVGLGIRFLPNTPYTSLQGVGPPNTRSVYLLLTAAFDNNRCHLEWHTVEGGIWLPPRRSEE